MKKESPCGFSSASAIIWYCESCNPVPFHDIYTSFATSFFQVVVTLPLGLLALQVLNSELVPRWNAVQSKCARAGQVPAVGMGCLSSRIRAHNSQGYKANPRPNA